MMTDEMISALEKKGFNRWTKGNMDRLYINATDLGLDCDYYKTGNIKGADFCEERVSNSEARRMKCAKIYIDIKTGEAHSDNYTLQCKVEEILDALTGTC